MSGGSFDYLFIRSGHELAARLDEVVAMRDRLIEIDRPGLARRTQLVIDAIESVGKQATGLDEAWKAVEWCDSGDSSPLDRDAILDKLESR